MVGTSGFISFCDIGNAGFIYKNSIFLKRTDRVVETSCLFK